MTLKKTILGLTLVTLCAGASLPAFADDHHGNGHGNGRGNSEQHRYEQRSEYNRYNHYYDDERYYERSNPRYIIIDDRDRYVIRDYMGHNPHGYGPPPGRGYKKVTYIIGRPLPRTVIWEPLPYELRTQLRPAPRGYQYVKVDRDVLLISQATKNVIDAVTLFSAVGR